MNTKGKIPPQALDLEEAVLGALLIEKKAVPIAMTLIATEEIFYKDQHKVIFSAIRTIWQKGSPVDLLTIVECLRSENKLDAIGGAYYLVELTNKVNSSANMEFHIKILLEHWVKREIIEVGYNILTEGYDDGTDCFELLNSVQTRALKVSESLFIGDTSELDKLVGGVVKSMEDAMNGIKPPTLSTGFSGLNAILNGWHKGDLVIVGARPAMGKTALALAFGLNVANEENVNIGVFSLEMSEQQLASRFLSMESKVDSRKIQEGVNLTEQEKEKIYHTLRNNRFKNIKVDDTAGLNVNTLRSKAINMKSKHDVKLIIVDYLQLLKGSKSTKGNREQEIAEISRTLKLTAKELQIPIIALSQLSRDLEKRPDKRPLMSDLRESGAIEQDADVIMFIYRDEYYEIDTHQEEGSSRYGLPTKGIAEVIVRKHRNGGLGMSYLGFDGSKTLFSDLKKQIQYNEPLPEKTNQFRYDTDTGEVFENAPF